jgi:hypothetical protein
VQLRFQGTKRCDIFDAVELYEMLDFLEVIVLNVLDDQGSGNIEI